MSSESRLYFNELGVLRPPERLRRFIYDVFGALTTVIDALGHATHFTYDEVGNVVAQTDANGHTTTFAYGNRGQLLQRTLPLGMTETMTYDAAGRVTSRTDFNGDTTPFSYDALGRVTTQTSPDTSPVTFTYTPTGRRASLTDSRGTTLYAYDARDRLVQVSHPDGTVLRTNYDAVGNRTGVTTPAGTVRYAYDARRQLATVRDQQGRTTRYAYDPAGNRQRVVYPNGTTTQYAYDALHRLTHLGHRDPSNHLVASYAYTLGPRGDRTTVTEGQGRRVEYAYDALARLTRETTHDPGAGSATVAYTYDAVGNRLTKIDASGTITHTYDANDRLMTAGPTRYDYDDNGNPLRRSAPQGTTTYVYDSHDRLVRATTPEGLATTYEYDADGHRLQKTDPTGVVQYLVDVTSATGLPQVVLETDGSGTETASYTYGDDLISMHRGPDVAYYHYDGHRSTRHLTDSAGLRTDAYTYDAFGVLRERLGTTDNPYLYAGEAFDPLPGLYYLRARYLDPAHGRFLTMDRFPGVALEPKSLHKYLYAHADPVNNVDPTGLVTFSLSGLSASIGIRGLLSNLGQFAASKFIERALNGANDQEVSFFAPTDLLYFAPFGGILTTVSQKGTPVGILYAKKIDVKVVKGFAQTFARTKGNMVCVLSNGQRIMLEPGGGKQGFRHIINRHLLDYWDGSKTKVNTMWPSGTTAGQVVRYLHEAIKKADTAIPPGKGVDVLLDNGIMAQLWVRLEGKVLKVDTFFPVRGPGVFDIANGLP